jgi:hypothetical protein
VFAAVGGGCTSVRVAKLEGEEQRNRFDTVMPAARAQAAAAGGRRTVAGWPPVAIKEGGESERGPTVPIDKVAEEQVVGVRHVAGDSEKLDHVVELSVEDEMRFLGGGVVVARGRSHVGRRQA